MDADGTRGGGDAGGQAQAVRAVLERLQASAAGEGGERKEGWQDGEGQKGGLGHGVLLTSEEAGNRSVV